MNRLEIIKADMLRATKWTKHIVNKLKDGEDMAIPTGLKSNVNWQVGHILTSRYFHSIVCIFGPQASVKEKMPMRDYISLFGMGSNPSDDIDKKPNVTELLTHLEALDQIAFELMEGLHDEDLDKEVLYKNPVAKTKFEAMMWSSQHQMYHNGQMSLIANLL